MVDTFVFANRAVTALQDSVDQYETVFDFGVDDLDRFPTLSGGSKFPVILSDREDAYEICYVTAVTVGGEATVERAREGTTAQSWSAGTFVEHCMTAGSFLAAARFVPKGEWSAVVNYLPGDVVEYTNISYLAVSANLNQVPSAASTYWQQLYQPPGISSTALTWSGDWNSGTTYAIGAYVKYQGKLYVAVAAGLNHLPSDASYWYPLGTPPDPVTYDNVLTAAGTNNYTVSPSPAPSALFDGMELSIIFTNTNNAACTLAVGALAPTPLRPTPSVEFAAGELPAATLLEVVYRSGSGEFITKSAAVFAKKIATLIADLAALDAAIDLSLYVPKADLATVTQFRAAAADKVLETDTAWSAAAFVTLTDGATINWSMNDGINFKVTLGGNRTLAFPTNLKEGQKGTIAVYQDATGGRTLSFGAGNWLRTNGVAISISTGSNDLNLLSYEVLPNSYVWVGLRKDLA